MPATPEQPQPAQPAPEPTTQDLKELFFGFIASVSVPSATTQDQKEEDQEPERPSPKRQKHSDPPTQTQLDAIRAATEDIQVAIDAIFNAEGAPDLDDIAAVVAANKNIVLLLDAISPPHSPQPQHKYAQELFDEAAKRQGQQKPAPV